VIFSGGTGRTSRTGLEIKVTSKCKGQKVKKHKV
jgi:hypothetical protein